MNALQFIGKEVRKSYHGVIAYWYIMKAQGSSTTELIVIVVGLGIIFTAVTFQLSRLVNRVFEAVF